MKSLAVLVLRFTEPAHREWKVPGNLHIGNLEIPFGLMAISAVLVITAVVNLFTKSEATVAGVIFSGVFFAIFTFSEHRVARERHGKPEQLDQFRQRRPLDQLTGDGTLEAVVHLVGVIEKGGNEAAAMGLTQPRGDRSPIGRRSLDVTRTVPELRDTLRLLHHVPRQFASAGISRHHVERRVRQCGDWIEAKIAP